MTPLETMWWCVVLVATMFLLWVVTMPHPAASATPNPVPLAIDRDGSLFPWCHIERITFSDKVTKHLVVCDHSGVTQVLY